MKIHALPVHPRFQPDRQNFRCPAHGQDWGVEQDFQKWLWERPDLLSVPDGADWDYLPIFWNRYYINNDWGHDGLDDLQAEIDRLVDPSRPTFTICEYDILALQPFLDLRGMRVFCASRRSDTTDLIDIPLLCSPHKRKRPEKRWLAWFNGNLETAGMRSDLQTAFQEWDDVYVGGTWMPPEQYAEGLESAVVGLAPRGQGAASFRFYEAMQLGAVPMLISDIDCLPFRKWIGWEGFSLWARSIEAAVTLLETIERPQLVEMGKLAMWMYDEEIQYGKWCRYVLLELQCLP